MSEILVTGGAGFIGSHIVEHYLQHSSHDILVIDDLSTGTLNNLPDNERVHFIQADVCDEQKISEIFRPRSFSLIYHLAAVASVQDSITDPVKTHKINFDSTLSLLEHARDQRGLQRFIFSSSAAVYGNVGDKAVSEDDPTFPETPYGIDKYASERYVLSYYKLFGVPTTAFRFFNVYGPRQNADSPYSGVISIFMDRLKKDQGISVFGDGEQSRDFIYVKDLVNIIDLVIQSEESLGKVYNLGTGRTVTLNRLIQVFGKITGKETPISYEAARKGDIRYSCSDINRLQDVMRDYHFSEILSGLSALWKYEQDKGSRFER